MTETADPNLKPEIRKITMGEAVQFGLLTPEGDPVRMVDASRVCWIVYPDSGDDPAVVCLNEGDALEDFDRRMRRYQEAMEDMTETADIPEDVMKAAGDALDKLLCNCRESCGSTEALRLASMREIARVIMAERDRCAKLMEQYPGGSYLAEVIRRDPDAALSRT